MSLRGVEGDAAILKKNSKNKNFNKMRLPRRLRLLAMTLLNNSNWYIMNTKENMRILKKYLMNSKAKISTR